MFVAEKLLGSKRFFGSAIKMNADVGTHVKGKHEPKILKPWSRTKSGESEDRTVFLQS